MPTPFSQPSSPITLCVCVCLCLNIHVSIYIVFEQVLSSASRAHLNHNRIPVRLTVAPFVRPSASLPVSLSLPHTLLHLAECICVLCACCGADLVYPAHFGWCVCVCGSSYAKCRSGKACIATRTHTATHNIMRDAFLYFIAPKRRRRRRRHSESIYNIRW